MDHAPTPAPTTEAGSRTSGMLAWIITLVLVMIIGALQFLGGKAGLEPVETDTGEAVPAVAPGAMFQVMGKYTVFASNVGGGGSEGAFDEPSETGDDESQDDDATQPASALGAQVLAPVQQMAVTQLDRLRMAMLAAEVISAERGLTMIDKVLEEEEQTDGIQQDADDLRAIYTGDADQLDDLARERLRDRHAWFGDLALVFGTPVDDPDRERVEAEASRIGAIVIAVFTIVVILGVAGVASFVTALILILTRRLRTHFVPPPPGGSVGVEIFAIFLISFMLVQALSILLYAWLGDGAAIINNILTWSLLLIPLWPLARGASLAQTRQLLGWHTGRGLFRELGAGLIGYLAGLPIVGLGIGLVFVLSFIWASIAGQEPPPPSHPMVDELGVGGVGMAVYLVVMMTVWAPLVEETMFRGALYSNLRARFNPIISALVTGFLFAAIHPQSIIAIPTLMSLGFVFALMREWRGSIIAPMIAHGLHNGMIAILLLFLFAG